MSNHMATDGRHDLSVAFQVMVHGDWKYGVDVAATEFEDEMIYHSPTYPGHTCWTCVWLMPDGELMLTFDQITGPVDHPKPDARARKVWHERFGKERGDWFIDNGYDATGLIKEVLLLGSRDGGRSWYHVGSRPYPGCIGVLDDPQSCALPDGTIVGTRYGHLIDDPEIPPTAVVHRSTDGGKTWSPLKPMLDPDKYQVTPMRPTLLRDGRLVCLVIYHEKIDPRQTMRSGAHGCVGLLISEDGGLTWSEPIVVMPNNGGFRVADESVLCELPSGDLFILHRMFGLQVGGDFSTAYSANRARSIMRREHKTFTPGVIQSTPLPHSAKPDIVYLKEDLILYCMAKYGYYWTADQGKSWHHLDLPGGKGHVGYCHQPASVQLQDGTVLSVYHDGFDDPYGKRGDGKGDQSIRAAWLKLRKTATLKQFSGRHVSIMMCGRPEALRSAVEVTLKPEEIEGPVGLIVRGSPGGFADEVSTMGYWLRIAGGQASIVKRDYQEKETVLATANLPASDGGSMRFRLAAAEDEIVATVDGKELMRVQDATYGYGGVGLFTEGCTADFVDPIIEGDQF